MENKELIEVLNTIDIQKMINSIYKCIKESLKPEFQETDDEIMVSYLKSFILIEYDKITNKYEKNKYIIDIKQGCFQLVLERFIKCINGTTAKMGDIVNKDVIVELKELLKYKDNDIYKTLSKNNKKVAKIIADYQGLFSINYLKKKAQENEEIKSYFEHIISKKELDVIEKTKGEYFLSNQIAHMLYDEKDCYFYYCDHNINSKDEIFKIALINTNESNPRFNIVFPDGIILEYHMGDIRIKRYTFKQVVDYSKLYFAMNFDEMVKDYTNQNNNILYGAPMTKEKLGRDMLINSYIHVRDMLEEYDNIYTQKMIDDYKKELVLIKNTSKKYHL